MTPRASSAEVHGRPAGNGRFQVNVISWSKTAEIAQLSNLARVEMSVKLTPEDCSKLGVAADNGLCFACRSVEGFLQALKAKGIEEQCRISLLSGKEAKSAGRALVEHISAEGRLVFLAGKALTYCSPEHRALIEWSIWTKFRDDPCSKQALLWTGDALITHNLGKFDPKVGKTSLPKQVFCRILEECRQMASGKRRCKSFQEILEAARSDSLGELQFYLPPSAV